jgi:dipeptidyl-peptidase-4
MQSFLKLIPNGLTLREIYTRPVAYGISPESLKWSNDGKMLAFLWSDQGGSLRDLYITTGSELRQITDARTIPPLPVEDDERPKADVAYAEEMARGVGEFDWVGDQIVYTVRGNLFVIDPSLCVPHALTLGSLAVARVKVCLADDRIGFVFNNNVWSYRLNNGELRQLTYFGKEGVSVTDYHWSPDGKYLAISVEDTSVYEKIRMPDYTPEKEVKINELRRNNAGKPLSKTRVGIVSSEGGLMSRVNLPAPGKEPTRADEIDTGDDHRIQSLAWTHDSACLLIGYEDSSYKDYRIVQVTPGKEADPKEVYFERSEPWFEYTPVLSTPDSKGVLFASYKDRWRRLYRLSLSDSELCPLTPEGIDISGFTVPKRGLCALVSAFNPAPTEQQVFETSLDGSGWKQISTGATNSSVFANDDGTRLAFLNSSVMSPPQLILDGKTLLNTAHEKFDQVTQPKVQRFSFTNASDNVTIHGKLILPHNFDPSKKYPAVLTCIYAGLGKEGFARYQPLDAFMANEMGYVIVAIDLRASMGYGRDFFFGYHKKLGIIDAEECVSCASYLRGLPFIDGDRIGLWGGSYGGFLTLMVMCNHPGVFHTGISWKPVTDWRNYWDEYIGPRLGRPQDDPEVYEATSPVFHAEGLEGNLLVVHGMLDDNVLFQDCAWMLQKLIEARKYFDLMIYPRDNHGLDLRHESLPDCMERFAAYFEEHMGLGPI